MLSLPKILFLILLAAGAWVAWRWYKRVGEVRRVDRQADRTATESRRTDAEVAVRCRVCGTYVAAGSGSCGRGDCPYGRG
jgi:hypothetical protein